MEALLPHTALVAKGNTRTCQLCMETMLTPSLAQRLHTIEGP